MCVCAASPVIPVGTMCSASSAWVHWYQAGSEGWGTLTFSGSLCCIGLVWLVLQVLMVAVCPWSASGVSGPEEGWALAYPECREKNQSPVNIVDQDTKVSTEYQELTLEGFDIESSNKTSMKNTGKTGEDHTDTFCFCACAETGGDCSRMFSRTQRSTPVFSSDLLP